MGKNCSEGVMVVQVESELGQLPLIIEVSRSIGASVYLYFVTRCSDKV